MVLFFIELFLMFKKGLPSEPVASQTFPACFSIKLYM